MRIKFLFSTLVVLLATLTFFLGTQLRTRNLHPTNISNFLGDGSCDTFSLNSLGCGIFGDANDEKGKCFS